MTHEDFRERTSESWFDPAGLLLAVPAEQDSDLPPLLGFHWTKVHRDEDPPYGEVYVVAVNPKAAGRGLGTVLTRAGLQHLRDQGLDSVLLYVDGDNDPAIAVYTGQGFDVERTEVQYRGTSSGRRRLRPASAARSRSAISCTYCAGLVAGADDVDEAVDHRRGSAPCVTCDARCRQVLGVGLALVAQRVEAGGDHVGRRDASGNSTRRSGEASGSGLVRARREVGLLGAGR